MKICMFTNTYLPHVGGVARSVDFFAEDLRNFGHQVLIVAPIFSNKNENERKEEVLRVPAIQNFNGSDFSVSISLPSSITAKINEFKPEIIHSHHPYLLGDAALRTARREQRPLVFTHHTLYEEYTHYVPLDSETLKRFVIHLSTRYANLCNGVVAPSKTVAALIQKRGVAVSVKEIPTGVDQDHFKNGDGERFRTLLGIPRRAKVIGHVGRLAPEKNLKYLAEVVALYCKKHEGVFMVVGEGSGKTEIRRVFENEGLSGRLFMAGERSGLELADAYNAMDLFVFASKTETQGMVLLEAMAAGKPVIALDASGVREVIINGVNGRLLEENISPDEFARVLEACFQNIGKTAMWREGALKTANRFSRIKCARSLLEFYEQLMEEKFSKEKSNNDLLSWERLQRALKTEWDLIEEKARALADAVSEDRRI